MIKAADVGPSVLQDTLVMFGDSITQGSFAPGGTGSTLAELYVRVFDVQNRGYGGYNTALGIDVARHWLPRAGEDRARTALMTIWFGANDATLQGSLQHIPLEQFKQNLRTMVNFTQDPASPYHSPRTKVVLITPPPILPELWAKSLAGFTGQPPVIDRSVEQTAAYAGAVKDVAEELGVPVVDAWTALTERAKQNEVSLASYLSDGLHLSAQGYAVVTEELKRVIAQDLPELHWEKQKRMYPEWRDIAEGMRAKLAAQAQT